MRKHFSTFLIALFLLMLASSARADSTHSATVRVEPNSGTRLDSFTLIVSFTGDQSRKFGSPRIGESKYFDVVSSGQSTQLQIVNGEATTRTNFSFSLRPKADIKPGRYQTPALSVEAGGKHISLERPHITITKEYEGQKSTDNDLDFDQKLSTLTPYVGQQVRYEARILAHQPTRNAELSDIEFDGFWVEPYPKDKQITLTLEEGSKVYILRKALFPALPAKLVVPERILTTEVQRSIKRSQPQRRRPSPWGFDPFANHWSMFDNMNTYQFVRTQLIADGVEVNVRPLPEAPAPNLSYIPVGHLQMASSLENTQLEVGEGTTLKIELAGTANLRPLEINETLSVKDQKNFKAYFDKPEIEVFPQGDFLGFKKTFSIALVPLVPGKLEIPEFTFWYFDPDKEKYFKLQTPSRQLFVKDSKGESFVVSNTTPNETVVSPEVKVLAEDLLPQHEGLGTLAPAKRISDWSFLFWLFALSIFTFIAQRLLAHFKLISNDPSFVARQNALRTTLNSLKAEPDLSDADTMRAFRKYLSDRFQVQGEALTEKEIAALVLDETKSKELAEGAAKLIKEFEARQFGGGPGTSSNDFSSRVISTIESIEEGVK